jgi:hypothetical protein
MSHAALSRIGSARRSLIAAVPILAVSLLIAPLPLLAQAGNMTFFITSAGPGEGADLGGLQGADAHCQFLAEQAGAGELTWHAYLSVAAEGDHSAIHARDRIGTGPWHNYAGVQIAANVAELHSDDANLTKETILTETGDMVNGRGDSPNMHDILTGSQLDGTAFGGDDDTTCQNWTSSGEGSARVGHHDRQGGGEHPESWNSAHGSRGCSQENLQGTGGNGFFYCFAIGGLPREEEEPRR